MEDSMAKERTRSFHITGLFTQIVGHEILGSLPFISVTLCETL